MYICDDYFMRHHIVFRTVLEMSEEITHKICQPVGPPHWPFWIPLECLLVR